MIVKNDIVKIYETVLAIPGMNEEVKLTLKTTRKNVLLLSKLIDRGLNSKDADEKTLSILEIVSEETLKELSEIPSELLERAGLTEMNLRLKSL